MIKTKQDWLKYAEENLPKFRYMFLEYGMEDLLQKFELFLRSKLYFNAIKIIFDLYARLPENIFNHIKNPIGWSELQELLENLPK